MREWNSFFQTCYYLCIVMIVFSVAIIFVNSLNLFTDVESGVHLGDTPDDIFYAITGFRGGAQAMWTALVIGTGVAALGVAVVTKSTNMIGVWLFSTVFWTGYHKCISVVDIGGWIQDSFLLMFTVAFLFLFVGAIIGMLTGSG